MEAGRNLSAIHVATPEAQVELLANEPRRVVSIGREILDNNRRTKQRRGGRRR